MGVMLTDAEFARRSEMYKARLEALDKGKEKLSLINGAHGLFTILTVIVGIVVLWLNPTVHWAIGVFITLVVVRFIGSVVVRHKFVDPEMKRIDKDFPAPPKLDRRSWS